MKKVAFTLDQTIDSLSTINHQTHPKPICMAKLISQSNNLEIVALRNVSIGATKYICIPATSQQQ